MNARIISGTLDINVLLSFIFGIIFISVMLAFALYIPNPSETTQWIFAIVVALAGAGIAAVVPGILEIDIPHIRSGGALAVFVAIMFFKPAIVSQVAKFDSPIILPYGEINAYFNLTDHGRLEEARSKLDPAARARMARNPEVFRRIYTAASDHLGRPIMRKEVGLNELESPSGYPAGIYQIVSYLTKFSKGGLCHMETVVVRAEGVERWNVYSHQVAPAAVQCPDFTK